jgi:hypothetical protein
MASRRRSRVSETEAAREPLKTAGEIAALLAGAVALLYVLGGAVLALRLILDSFRLDAAWMR